MVSVQHPAVAAAAFWQAPSQHHVFAFPASAQCGALVPQWHLPVPSTSGSCVNSVSSHALSGHLQHHSSCHRHTPVTSGGGLGDGLGSLGQALASSAAAFLPQLAPQTTAPLAAGPPLSHHVLLNPQSFAAASPVPLPVPRAVATVDPEQPIGYGSFGVVWYVVVVAASAPCKYVSSQPCLLLGCKRVCLP